MFDETRLDALVGRLLRIGVVVAAAITGAAGALYLVRHGAEPAHYEIFHGEPAELRHVSGILSEASRLGARGLIQLGLLVLVATPIARVAFAAAGFLAAGDRQYAAIAGVVLLLLLAGLLAPLY